MMLYVYIYIIPFNHQQTRGFEHSFGDHSLNTITIIAVTKKDIRSFHSSRRSIQISTDITCISPLHPMKYPTISQCTSILPACSCLSFLENLLPNPGTQTVFPGEFLICEPQPQHHMARYFWWRQAGAPGDVPCRPHLVNGWKTASVTHTHIYIRIDIFPIIYICIYIYGIIRIYICIYWDGNSTVPKNIKGFGYISSRCHFFCLAHAPSVCTKTSAVRKWQIWIWSAKWCFNFLHNDMDTRSMRSWLALPEHICFSRKLMEVAVSQSGPLNRQDELPHHPHSRSLCP